MELDRIYSEANQDPVGSLEWVLEKWIDNSRELPGRRGGVVYLEVDRCLVIGDIHGDLDTLHRLLTKTWRGEPLLFLGDYIDRGFQQLETLKYIALLMDDADVITLRGNHEPPRWLPVYPHDFPHILRTQGVHHLYDLAQEMFDSLPIGAVLNGEALAIHGGIPVSISRVEELERPRREVLAEALWNDPFEGVGIKPSPRGVGHLYGIDVTRRFLGNNGLRYHLRGHEAVDGYKVFHEGMGITLFSRLGIPYGNSRAAIYIYEPGGNHLDPARFIYVFR